jgi:hypothetical protein
MGGEFTHTAGFGTALYNLVAFNGSVWSRVVVNGVPGVDGTVTALAAINNTHLAISGRLRSVGGRTVTNNFVFFNGSAFASPLRSDAFGFGTGLSALHVDDSRLYMGGDMAATRPDLAPVGNFAWLNL